ncbi:hypothetical protein N7540_002479 [Penicillium herquei]|nr:hypothetical protein N7540_002479 [Penicillium herquei]
MLISIVGWTTITSGSSVVSHPVTETSTLTLTSVITCTEGCNEPTAPPQSGSSSSQPAEPTSSAPGIPTSAPSGSKSVSVHHSSSTSTATATPTFNAASSQFKNSLAGVLPGLVFVWALI